MPQRNDLSRSLVALDQDSTIIAVVEMSQSSWLVAGMLPGIERQPRKKLGPSPERLLGLLHGWRDEAVKAGRKITRIALAFEASRDDFWLARWLRANGMEAHVIHPSSPGLTHSLPPQVTRKCPKIAGAAASTSKRAGRGDRRGGRNLWRAGAAQFALRSTEFGGRCLEFGEPAGGSRCRHKGSGWRRRAAVSRIHLTFVLYARERLQREGGKRVKNDNRCLWRQIRAKRRRHRYSGL